MRIVHLITHLRLGAGRAVVDLAVHQSQRRGHTVLVAIADDAQEAWRSDERLLRELHAAGIATAAAGDFFHRRADGLAASARSLRCAAGDWDADTVVHAHTAMAAAVARWAGASRIVATCHGWDVTRPAEYTLQDALAFTLADAITSPSTHWAGQIAALPGAPRVHVVPYGFDLSRYPPHQTSPGPSGALRVVCIGELTRRKGQDLLLDAMPQIWRELPDAALHLIGDGDLAPILRQRALQLDPGGQRLVFRGHLAAPYDELAGFDLLCLPTRSDNQPVAIVEAMLAGLPIVATDVGGIPDMVDAGRCGETVRAGCGDDLAAAILRLWRREDRAAIGMRGRAFARQHYDVVVSAERMDALYRGGSSDAG